ncbi:MAG: hypothetical protein RLZZ524_1189, partial [Pseudomonadota bacterium]
MSIAISISPGTVLQEGERVSTAKLNKLGTPTAAGTAALNDLDDVAIINPVSGQLLGYNGSEDRWEPTATLPEGSNPEMIGSVYGGTGHVYDYNVNTTSHIITTTAA